PDTTERVVRAKRAEGFAPASGERAARSAACPKPGRPDTTERVVRAKRAEGFAPASGERAARSAACPKPWRPDTTERSEGVAGRQGFDPRYHGPEPCVLPLDDLPAGRNAQSSQARVRVQAADPATARTEDAPARSRGIIAASQGAMSSADRT